jgi:hypothetical protein
VRYWAKIECPRVNMLSRAGPLKPNRASDRTQWQFVDGGLHRVQGVASSNLVSTTNFSYKNKHLEIRKKSRKIGG